MNRLHGISVARILALLGTVLLAVALPQLPARGQGGAPYELWVIDQADYARGGARLYIYDGARLDAGQPGTPEVVDLFASAAGVGEGAGVRPHMLEFTPTFTHGIIANVASGHVYVMRARDRKMVASIDVGEQVHHAVASADGAFIVAANQNGKRLARIRADFAAERFTYNRDDDLNLGAMEDAAHPDNAPICPVLEGRKAYVTVRGGGLYIVDYRATPMRVLKTYGREQVGPAGCGGVVVAGKVFINSGTATTGELHVFSAPSDTLLKSLRLTWTGADSHGMVLVGGPDRRYLWVANRADGNIVVISVAQDAMAGLIGGVGAAPDIMARSPGGNRVFAALRGPNNLTGGPSAKGQTPGFAVMEVTDQGRSGRRIAFVPIGEQTATSPADPHTLAVRPLR